MFRFYSSILFFALFVLFVGQTAVLAQDQTPKPDIKPQASPAPSPEKKNRWSGSYQATFNVSVLGKPKPSLGHKFSLSYAPTFGGSFDSRFEYYVEGSYNADPPGQLINNINEPKFEAQINYTRTFLFYLARSTYIKTLLNRETTIIFDCLIYCAH
jgi:hypothetical protein